jgi:hypothetical protein
MIFAPNKQRGQHIAIGEPLSEVEDTINRWRIGSDALAHQQRRKYFRREVSDRR